MKDFWAEEIENKTTVLSVPTKKDYFSEEVGKDYFSEEVQPPKISPAQSIAQKTASTIKKFTPELLTGGMSFPVTHPEESAYPISKFFEGGERVSRGIGTATRELLERPVFTQVKPNQYEISKNQPELKKSFLAGFAPELYPDYPKDKITTLGEMVRKTGEEVFKLYGTPEEAIKFNKSPRWQKNLSILGTTAGQTVTDFISIIPDVYTNPANYLTLKAVGEVGRLTPLDKINITKKLTTEYKMPERITIPAKIVSGIQQGIRGAKLDTPEMRNLITTLGKDNWRKAVTEGIDVNVPVSRIVTLTDRPYWGKIKQFFGKEPMTPKVTREFAGEIKPAPAGLLPEPIIKPTITPPQAGGLPPRPPVVSPILATTPQVTPTMPPVAANLVPAGILPPGTKVPEMPVSAPKTPISPKTIDITTLSLPKTTTNLKVYQGNKKIIVPVADKDVLRNVKGITKVEFLTKTKEGFKILDKIELPQVKTKIPKVSYSISQENYENVIQGKSVGKIGLGEKIIPPKTVTGVIEWEKTEPWKVNLGRNITGVFEREIGPKLQVSTRFKKWLGAYYPMLGESGTIKVRNLADEMTLNHETGHFLDDVLKGYPIEKRGDIRNELIKITKNLRPFEEQYTKGVSAKTGKPLKIQTAYTAYRRSRSELFADYISLYTKDSIKAKQLAPKFTKIIEDEIAKNNEFSYVIDKLREFESVFKPVKDYVAYVESIRKVPEFEPFLREWEKQGNVFQQLWRSEFADKLWNKFTSTMDEISKNVVLREAFEKKGLDNPVFEVLRQRSKIISGQLLALEEEHTQPISKLSEADQQYVAENFQRFETLGEDTPLGKLADNTRIEITFRGLEAKKLGLLNEKSFWNNVGQHFPFMYSEKEFADNKTNFGFFPYKQLRANLSGLKHRLTDKEMGIKTLEAQLGTWPSSKAKIAQYTEEELIKLGQKAREELGLIKTAAYPLKKRLSQLIEAINTVKSMNVIAKLPGVIGSRDMKGYVPLPVGAKYGLLSGQYVTENLAREITSWEAQTSQIGKIYDVAISVVKAFKVPFDPNAMVRNPVTNMFMAWFGDIPIYNPAVVIDGIKAHIARGDIYKTLRDYGLYRHSFSQEELQKLVFLIEKKPENGLETVLQWAVETYKIPGEIYGRVEDISKTIIANYALKNGASPMQAVQLADKWLFDYSSVSDLTKKIRRFPLPFWTWSVKAFPRILETGIRKPEKILTILAVIGTASYLVRKKLGITREEEENLKPDYIKGKSVLLVGKDKYGRLNWVDLSFFMPWWGWMPSVKGEFGLPQALTGGNPLMAFYDVGVSNYDPYYQREIAPESMSKSQKTSAQVRYLTKKLGPRILTQAPFEIYNSIRGVPKTNPPEISKILAGDFLGLKFVKDISPYKGAIKYKIFREFVSGMRDIDKQEKDGYITKEKADKLKKDLQYEYKEKKAIYE